MCEYISIISCNKGLISTRFSSVLCLVLSHVWLFATPGTVAHQAPLSTEILQAMILEWVAMLSSRGMFPIQGSNSGLPHCRQIHYRLSHQGNPDSQQIVSKKWEDSRRVQIEKCLETPEEKVPGMAAAEQGPFMELVAVSADVWMILPGREDDHRAPGRGEPSIWTPALVLPAVPFCRRGWNGTISVWLLRDVARRMLPDSRGMAEQRWRGGKWWGKGAGWGKQSREGRTNLRFCTRLWKLPHPTTRCHQTQNPQERRLRKKPGNLNPKNSLHSVPEKS